MTPLPRELAPRCPQQQQQHVRERATRRIDKGGSRGEPGEARQWQSILEVVSTLSHDLTISQDDERTAIREAGMPSPLEIERVSQAGPVRRRCQNYSSRSALFICRLIRPDKTVRRRLSVRPSACIGRTIGRLPARCWTQLSSVRSGRWRRLDGVCLHPLTKCSFISSERCIKEAYPARSLCRRIDYSISSPSWRRGWVTSLLVRLRCRRLPLRVFARSSALSPPTMETNRRLYVARRPD